MGKLIRNGIEYGGGNGTDIFEVTQAQYDALVQAGTLVHNALYVISDAPNLNATASDIEYSSGVTVKQAIDRYSKSDFTIAKGSTMPTGFPIPNTSRRGHICIINFAIQLPVGTYTNSDTLWVLSVTPIANTRALVNVGGIQLLNILTDGTVKFNSNVTLSGATYILGQAVFLTDS